MDDLLVISSDSHVFEPPDLWTERIDAEFRDPGSPDGAGWGHGPTRCGKKTR